MHTAIRYIPSVHNYQTPTNYQQTSLSPPKKAIFRLKRYLDNNNNTKRCTENKQNILADNCQAIPRSNSAISMHETPTLVEPEEPPMLVEPDSPPNMLKNLQSSSYNDKKSTSPLFEIDQKSILSPLKNSSTQKFNNINSKIMKIDSCDMNSSVTTCIEKPLFQENQKTIHSNFEENQQIIFDLNPRALSINQKPQQTLEINSRTLPTNFKIKTNLSNLENPELIDEKRSVNYRISYSNQNRHPSSRPPSGNKPVNPYKINNYVMATVNMNIKSSFQPIAMLQSLYPRTPQANLKFFQAPKHIKTKKTIQSAVKNAQLTQSKQISSQTPVTASSLNDLPHKVSNPLHENDFFNTQMTGSHNLLENQVKPSYRNLNSSVFLCNNCTEIDPISTPKHIKHEIHGFLNETEEALSTLSPKPARPSSSPACNRNKKYSLIKSYHAGVNNIDINNSQYLENFVRGNYKNDQISINSKFNSPNGNHSQISMLNGIHCHQNTNAANNNNNNKLFGAGQSNKMHHKIEEIKKKLNWPAPSLSQHFTNIESQNIQNQSEGCANASIVSDEYLGSDNSYAMEDFEEEIESTSGPTGQIQRRPSLILLKSIYECRPPTIFFQYPSCCEQVRETSRTFQVKPEEEKLYEVKYKSGAFLCIIKTFEAAGFRRTSGSTWNAIWGKPNKNRIKDMNKYQKFNHFPGCWQLGRKDNLWRNLSRMRRQFPLDYNFMPNTYILSSDWDRFIQVREVSDPKSLWIMKPVASACGRGIKIINKRTKLHKVKDYLVSEYIANPHLINGFKYDLRLYVLVTSYDPLRIYFYNEGLVRFATEEYTTNSKLLKKKFIHLTNWSVNKYSETFIANQNAKVDNEGSKWSLKALIHKYEEMGINTHELFSKIHDIIIKTIISAEPYMLGSLNRSLEHRSNCYELYGFDILIDSQLKPWIMEVNVCPSLNCSTPLDKRIKVSLISDIMNLIGYQVYDKKKYEEESKKRTPGTSFGTVHGETKKHQTRNINEIADLNEFNCLDLLSPEDWNILFETDEELYRRGDFERIFPLKENIDKYKGFFEFVRYNNLLIWNWLKCRVNFLELVYKKIANV